MYRNFVEITRQDWEQEGGYPNYRIPGIVRTKKGTIIVCYECRFAYDWSVMDIAIRRSCDEGKTWSERSIVVSGEGRNVVHNAVMFVSDDRVHMIWHRNYRQAFYIYSDDEGVSWSAPGEITYAYEGLREQFPWTVIAAGPGHGMVTSSCRLIVPVWLASNREDITQHRPSVISTLYSDDGGATWACGEIVYANPEFVNPSESVLAELTDGSIMICCRHETPMEVGDTRWDGMRQRKIAYSADGTGQWHGWHFEPSLPDCTCSAGMTQSEGKIWISNCPERNRTHLSLSVSADEGKTWHRHMELALYGGYSDIFYHPETGRIYGILETYAPDEKEIMGKLSLEFIRLDPEELE